MDNQCSVVIRINPTLKKMSDHVFQSLGMNTHAGIKLFLSQMVLHQQFPFELTLSEPMKDVLKEKKTVSLVVRIDSDIKAKCTELTRNAGLNLSLAIKLYLVQVVDKNAIPFQIMVNERV